MEPVLTTPKRRFVFEAARAARLAAVQALFQIRTASESVDIILTQFTDNHFKNEFPHEPDRHLFETLVKRVIDRDDDLIRMIDANLSENWSCAHLDPVLREILKTGALELLEPITTVPAHVIISEYVDLAQGFLSSAEANMVNAVLDPIAHALNLKLKKD